MPAKFPRVIPYMIGLVRYGDILRLALLQYDEKLAEDAEAAKIAELNGSPAKPQTNRELQRGNRNIDMTNSLYAVQSIRIGEKKFDINEMETTRCDWQNWHIPVLLTEFLRQGWNPTGIEHQRIDNLFLTFARLSGKYEHLPEVGENPEVQLAFRKEYISHLVEQPVILPVGTDYLDRLYFQDKNTGEKHWVQINRVYLMDIWAEMMKNFNDPRLAANFTATELAEHQAELESRLAAICPQGIYFPVIEYECEEDISLQFHSQEWLDAVPEKSSCMGFSIGREKKTGILGLPLKAALIVEPMPKDCLVINAELFSYNLPQKYDDVIF